MNLLQSITDKIASLIGPEKQFKTSAEFASFCGVGAPYISRLLNKGSGGRTLEPFGQVLEGLGAQIIFPGDLPPEKSIDATLKAENAKLQKECDDLRKERDHLARELISTQRMVIRLKDGQPPVLYPPAGQEKRKDTELRESEKEYDEPPVVQEEPLRYDSGGKDALNGK